MSKKLLGIGDVYTYDYKQVHKTRNVGFGYYDPAKVSTTSSTDGYVLVDGVLSVVNEGESSGPGPGPEPVPDPYNPLNLPPYTIRLKYKQGTTPTFSRGTGVIVDAENNIWDLTYENNDWRDLLEYHTDLIEVLGANTTNVTSMRLMLWNCSSLTNVSLFDTADVEDMYCMFASCSSISSVPQFDTNKVKNIEGMLANTQLTSVPLFDTSNVTNMIMMLFNCYNVQSGALALYNQASTQENPPLNHSYAFYNCGSNTETGSAELAQIPDDWKGE